MLYDNQDDPDQARNLAGQPSHGATQARLEGLVQKWFTATRDDWTERQDQAYR